MAISRDDFTEKTKQVLARRVGYCCSKPDCGISTESPHTNREKYLSIGVAAHITAASPLGPRYNQYLTPKQRKSIDNGIWLCESHAKLIDKDPDRFRESLLLKWKKSAEARALKGSINSLVIYSNTLPSSSGQLMTIDNFILFHHRFAGEWVTPIDNPMIGREDESKKVLQCLRENKVVVVGGSPGVGKTKFAIEILRAKQIRSSTPVFVVKNDNGEVWNDLKYLKQRLQNFILLIDDADRQLPLVQQVLALIKGSEESYDIQLVLTVRSVAKRDLEEALQRIDWREIRLAGPTDESIRKMITSEPYLHSDPVVIRRIVQVAHNNARFAMMVARLAKDDPTALNSGKIGDIYKAYYKKYIREVEELDNPDYIKVLGLLSIFRTIRTDKDAEDYLQQILSFAGLNEEKFLECTAGLDKRELIECDYDVVKMDDQHLKAYYFYRAFIEDRSLDFGKLLTAFYHPNNPRFRNIIYSASEDFGREEVLTALGPALTRFGENLNGKDLILFYLNFGDLWPERYMYFVGAAITKIPKTKGAVYLPIPKDNKDRDYSQDSLLQLVSKSFKHADNNFLEGLELAFEYVRRKPELVQNLVSQLRTDALYYQEDNEKNDARHHLLFESLFSGVTVNDALSKRVFLEMVDSYLRGVSGVRSFLTHFKNHKKQSEEGNIVEFEPFRENVWIALIQLYDEFPQEVTAIVKLTRHRRVKSYRQLIEIDRKYLIILFSKKFSPKRIEEVMIVHEIIGWLETKKMNSPQLELVKAQYSIPEIQLFNDLSWRAGEFLRRVKGRDMKAYAKQKREELKTDYIFNSTKEFEIFLSLLKEIYFLPESEKNRILLSVDMILANNQAHDHALGLTFLKQYINVLGPRVAVANTTILESVSGTKENSVRFFEWLAGLEQKESVYWRASAFHYLPIDFISEQIKAAFLAFVSTFQNWEELRLDTLRKFSEGPKQLTTLLQLWLIALRGKNIQPRFADLEELTEEELVNNIEVIKSLYLIFGRDGIFDLERNLLRRILHLDATFFVGYVREIVSHPETGYQSRRDEELGFVWSLPGAGKMMAICLNLVLADRYVSVATFSTSWLDSYFDPFFSKITEGKEKAEAFALDYVEIHATDARKIRTMIDCIGKNLPSIVIQALYRYLDANQSVDDFQRIDWGNLMRVPNDEEEGKDYSNSWLVLQDWLKDYPNRSSIFEIKQLIRERLLWAKRNEERRKRDVFIGNPW